MFRLLWGDTHDNTYQAPDPEFSMDRRLETAARHLDFYCAAYYPYTSPAFRKGGHPSEHTDRQPLNVETWKSVSQIEQEWRTVKEAVGRINREGDFLAFPGFEWQGDGTMGDHNVFFLEDDPPLLRVDTLPELYDQLRCRRALAIPHHTAYITGFRGKNWAVHDDALSPFVEIFSVHGSSEGESFGGALRNNPFLGPDVDAGAYTTAIRRGCRIGIIASTDNWGPMPGHYGRGLAAVWAKDLTRTALWEAFQSRRVYGVTGDRISLQFQLEDHPMGSVVTGPGRPPVFRVQVEALDRIDSIDLVRDETLVDRVSVLEEGGSGLDLSQEFLFRVEYGWGPAANVLTLPPKEWIGAVHVEGAEIVQAVPCWISPEQNYTMTGTDFSFSGTTTQETVGHPVQNGYVLKLRGRKDARIALEIDGERQKTTLEQMCSEGTVLWNRRASADLIGRHFSTDAEALERKDVLFGMAYKTKIHQALPAPVYTRDISFTDDLYDGNPHSYRVRVRQRNGHMAWSSPIWLE
jgi:hypothetical protein